MFRILLKHPFFLIYFKPWNMVYGMIKTMNDLLAQKVKLYLGWENN